MARSSGKERGSLWGVWSLLENREAHHILHPEKSEPLNFIILHTAPYPIFPVALPLESSKLFGSIQLLTQVGTKLEITSRWESQKV